MKFPVPILLLLPLLLGSGCHQQEPSAPVLVQTFPVAEWESKLQVVREGGSSRIIADSFPVTTQQFSQLLSVAESLKQLELDQSLVSPEAFASTLPGLKALERLKLSGPASDVDLQTIARLPKLEILNLPRAEITDDGLQTLCSHEELNFLRIRAPQVSDAGLATICRIPGLRFLHLIDVPITDAGLIPLAGLKQLESFYLDGSECTEAGLSKLIQQLPDLHFHWNQLHLPNDPKADH